jgi:hypothetical protein
LLDNISAAVVHAIRLAISPIGRPRGERARKLAIELTGEAAEDLICVQTRYLIRTPTRRLISTLIIGPMADTAFNPVEAPATHQT